MNHLASVKIVDDTKLDAQVETDIEVSPHVLIKPDLDDAEAHLDMKRLTQAEYALNRAAAIFAALDVPNTSRRYRILSRRAAYARVGEVPTDEEEPTLPFGQRYEKA